MSATGVISPLGNLRVKHFQPINPPVSEVGGLTDFRVILYKKINAKKF
jgi:hypothetical protein